MKIDRFGKPKFSPEDQIHLKTAIKFANKPLKHILYRNFGCEHKHIRKNYSKMIDKYYWYCSDCQNESLDKKEWEFCLINKYVHNIGQKIFGIKDWK